MREKVVNIELGERSYPIFIGPQLLAEKSKLVPYIDGKSVLIVTNEIVAPLYLEKVRSALSPLNVEELVLPDGEQYKTLDTVNTIFTYLLENKFDRNSTLVALGGGVVGDITGFAAACYQRGVPFIQIPTTLLAQVDSSVGGKTGVNHALGKNMIGAFHQPRCVIADINTLETLDDRQLSAGMAEVIKYGLIGDSGFFDWLEANADKMMKRDSSALTYAVERSCKNKAVVVEKDERESGARALLNLGHTFGHAIETAMGYGAWLHGEAVAAGTCMAAKMSMKMGWLPEHSFRRLERVYHLANLPTQPPREISVERFLEIMSVDKKVQDGALRLVLLKDIGRAVVTSNFDHGVLEETIRKYH